MKIAKRAFILSSSILCLLFLSLDTAYSQSIPPRTYLFVEVKDTEGKEITDATLTLADADGNQLATLKTDKGGVVKTTLQRSSYHHYNLQISKPGYLPSEQVFFSKSDNSYFHNIVEGIPPSAGDFKNFEAPPIKIVLLKAPATRAERERVEAEEPKRQLMLAVKRGETGDLLKLLQAGVKATTTDAGGVPAIAWAVFAGDAEIIRLLLDAGADVRSKNKLGHQALLIYLSEGIFRDNYTKKDSSTGLESSPLERHDEIVRRLIKAGAGLNFQDSSRGTVLNKAIGLVPYSLSIETIQELLAAKANVNAPDENGITPLMLAAAKAQIQVFRLLLGTGARPSVNAKDKQGRTALLNAAQGYKDGGLEIVKVLLIIGAKVNEVDESGQTALMLAAKGNSLETVKTLMEAGAGASINAKDKEGQTALILAVNGSQEDTRDSSGVVKALLAAGANVNDVDKHGRTALMYAAYIYRDLRLEAARALIAAGANVNTIDEEGQTALIIAARMNSVETVKALLAAGAKASINVKDKKGRTALVYAVSEHYGSGYSGVVKALVEAEADVNAADENGQTPLMIAVQKNSEQTVKMLLAANASVNAKDKEGLTALMYARAGEDSGFEIVKALIAARTNVSDVDATGQTPLMLAASKDYNLRMVKALLETDAKASVNAKDKYGKTALMVATYSHNPEVFRALIAAGANVNDVDERGQTALMYVVDGYRESRIEIANVLIAAGANVNAADANGRTALLHLTEASDPVPGIVKALIAAGENVNAADADGMTPLMLMAKWNSAELIQMLLAAGASINAKDKKEQTPLLYAVSQGYRVTPSVVKALIAAKANVNDVNEAGQTPLMFAAQARSLEAMKMLLDAGASINAKDKQGQTALKYALIGNRESAPDLSSDAIQALITAGADVNDVDAGGMTPLMLAAKLGNIKTIQPLLAAGASINAKDKLGQTALMYAASEYFSSPAVVEALIAAGANALNVNERGQTVLMLAAPRPSLEIIKMLIATSVPINAKDKEGKTALMYAAMYGDRESSPEIIKALIAAGARLDDADEEGQTALMLVARNDALEALKTLLAAGAPVNAKDKKGQTTLMHAIKGSNYRRDERVKLLVASGADVGIKDNEGQTALSLARKDRLDTIIKLLEEAESRH